MVDCVQLSYRTCHLLSGPLLGEGPSCGQGLSLPSQGCSGGDGQVLGRGSLEEHPDPEVPEFPESLPSSHVPSPKAVRVPSLLSKSASRGRRETKATGE